MRSGWTLSNARMFSFLAVIALAQFFVSHPASAQMGVTAIVGGQSFDSPGGPPYYSGTNCLVGWRAGTASQGTWLTDVKFYIGSELIPTPPLPGPPNWVGGQTSSVTFDSTHFPDGTSLTIRVECTNNLGETASRTSPAKPVYNKGVSYGNNTLNNGYGITSAQNVWVQQQAIFPTSFLGTQDRKPTMLADIPIFTHYFVVSHGDSDSFGDCFALASSNYDYYLSSTEIYARLSAKGESIPPYAFVHCDSCKSATETWLADGFDITSSSVDRAFLGWTTDCPGSLQVVNWVKRVWQLLAAQETVQYAVRAANLQWPPGATARIIGDNYTKVHGVYLGYAGQWFR